MHFLVALVWPYEFLYESKLRALLKTGFVRVGVAVLLVVLLTPRLWERFERFDTGPACRVPYQLSKDLYGRRLRQVADHNQVVVLASAWQRRVGYPGAL